MECEICFESYDNEDRTPLVLACKCRKIMCLSCVLLRLKSTARCPYCSIRWSVRNYVAQCRDGTPSNLLDKLLLAFQAKEPEIPLIRASSVLGSGELRNYYEKFLEENGRKAEEKSAEQVNLQLISDGAANEVFCCRKESRKINNIISFVRCRLGKIKFLRKSCMKSYEPKLRVRLHG